MILALLFLACPEPDETGDSAPVVDSPPPDALTCDPAVVKFDGADPPKLGDIWSFWLTCDDAVQMGPSRPSVDPSDAGTITDGASTPQIEWKAVGEATLHLQTGRFEGERVVTVLAAE